MVRADPLRTWIERDARDFLTWFRDAIFGSPVSNFTGGFEITFQ